MTEVHDIAARGFGAQAAAYDQARPSYPADAVAWLSQHLGITRGRTVIDLAAGTGKLTELIWPGGASVVAIEPVGGMREQFRRRLPDVSLLAGVAEAIPLAAGSVDAVLVGQAFHWFDAPRAMTELARVVRAGGRIGLIWNGSDRSVSWVDQVWSVMDRVEHNAPWRDYGQGTGGQPSNRRTRPYLSGAADEGWSPWTEATFRHIHRSSHEQVIDRMRSVSHIAALAADRQRAVLDEIRAILREHPQTRETATVAIPYRVDAMYAERLGTRR